MLRRLFTCVLVLASVTVAGCPSSSTSSPPASSASPAVPTSCQDINAEYKDLVNRTSCAADADCSDDRTSDLFCFGGPYRINGRSPEATRLAKLQSAFSASCTALPCTPAIRKLVTQCTNGLCVTRDR